MSNHNHQHFANVKVERQAGSEAHISGELTVDFIKECRPEALKALSEQVEIAGFRKGNIPENILVKNLGEMRVLEEVSEVALAREYANIIKESKLSPIGRPKVAITKLAPGIPLEFKITVTLEPEFELPDYKKIAKESVGEDKDLSVTDAEVDAVLEEIKKQGWDPKLKEGESLKDKARDNLVEEKKFRAKELRRLKIIEALVKETKIEVPQLLIDHELEKMLGQFRQDVERHGMRWDEYLKSIKKTEEEIRSEWVDKAEHRAKAELVIAKISEVEKLEPKTEELEHEAKHMLEHHPEADPLRVRLYVFQALRTQKVFEFLETR